MTFDTNIYPPRRAIIIIDHAENHLLLLGDDQQLITNHQVLNIARKQIAIMSILHN